MSTADGSTIWELHEPVGSSLMSTVHADGDVVYVSVNSLPWTD